MNRCGFVHMQTEDAANNAIKALNNSVFNGANIVVERGRMKERKPGVGGGPGKGNLGGPRQQGGNMRQGGGNMRQVGGGPRGGGQSGGFRGNKMGNRPVKGGNRRNDNMKGKGIMATFSFLFYPFFYLSS